MPRSPLYAAVTLLLLALCPSGVFAIDGFDVSASVSSSVEDNVFRTAGGEDDVIRAFSAGIAPHWKWTGCESAVFYDGTIVDFSRYSESSYAVHNAGATLDYFPKSSIRVRGGIDLVIREGSGSTDLYDYSGNGVFCELQLPLSLDWTARGGLSRRTKEYRVLHDFDNKESVASFHIEHRFPDGASFALRAEAGAKDYLGGPGSEARQLLTSLRVSLPMGERTGLRLRVSDRLSFGGEALVASGVAADGYWLEDLYDDPYGYEGMEGDAMVSHLFQGGVMLRIGCGAKLKSYDRAVLDGDGVWLADGPRREDVCLEASAGAEKTLRLNRQGALLKLSAGWYVSWSESNDALYRYRASSAGLGAEVLF
ncbi:hypothetical protein [Pelodictyon luteolum]|uniref:Uncharacterized protein n=1 Tax=Chlorobium luteolum (strain DSM 273 / BCRC 81028 / 2530) TaxID=319225 RepID=Q3B5Z6_CHLL3|nr:hypothetical protein [Pelodictyon luteolum]ABB23235.1 hypothetical protein Plut_0347 [Pelodictyon luteolum DSM 273]